MLSLVGIELMSETGKEVATDIRLGAISMVMQALAALSLPPPDLSGIESRMLVGENLTLVDDLGLDSLGAMEFCIYLELELEIVVIPEDLILCDSATKLICLVESSLLGLAFKKGKAP